MMRQKYKITLETGLRELSEIGIMTNCVVNMCLLHGISKLRHLYEADNRYSFLFSPGMGSLARKEIDMVWQRYLNLRVGHYDYFEEDRFNLCYERDEKEFAEVVEKFKRVPVDILFEMRKTVKYYFRILYFKVREKYPELNNLAEAVEFAFKPSNLPAEEISPENRTYIIEVNRLLEVLREYFEEELNGIDISSSVQSYGMYECKILGLKEVYPFLTREECESIFYFSLNNWVFPWINLARKFILQKYDNPYVVARYYFGIDPRLKKLTMEEICETYKLKPTSFGYYLMKGIPLPESIENRIWNYVNPLMEPIMPIDSEIWEKIQRDNMLKEPLSMTARFICFLLQTHVIVKFNSIEEEFVISKKLNEAVRFKTAWRKIRSKMKKLCNPSTNINILECIHEPGKLTDDETALVCHFFSELMENIHEVETHEVEPHDNRFVENPDDEIDVAFEIIKILEDRGEQMSLTEIFNTLKNLFPGTKIKNEDTLKPYLRKHNGIKFNRTIRKYCLTGLEDYRHYAITDYIVEVLGAQKKPLEIEILVKDVRKKFPGLDRKLIQFLVENDMFGRIVIYIRQRYGTRNNISKRSKQKELIIRETTDFNSSFKKLKKFVKDKKRLPVLSCGDNERDLCIWIKNVLNYQSLATDDQVEGLRKFLSADKTRPQNFREFRFRIMCDRINEIVEQTSKLPSASKHKLELEWLNKEKNNYSSYDDNRKKYFKELINNLLNKGLEV